VTFVAFIAVGVVGQVQCFNW